LFLPIIVYNLSSKKIRDKGKIVSAGQRGGRGGEGGVGGGKVGVGEGGEMIQTLYAHMNKIKI
jgi:hypothetical protein